MVDKVEIKGVVVERSQLPSDTAKLIFDTYVSEKEVNPTKVVDLFLSNSRIATCESAIIGFVNKDNTDTTIVKSPESVDQEETDMKD